MTMPPLSDTPKLLPCPFCGSPAEPLPGSRLPPTIEEFLTQPPNVRCSSGKCGARYCPGGFQFDEWNRRDLSAMRSEWRGIETAPKDGTAVLVTDGEVMEVARNLGSGWQSSDGLDFGYGAWDDRLTYWQPLPAPPAMKPVSGQPK